MADIPVLRSKEQILGDLVDGFLARVDSVNDVSRQSVLMQFLNAVAQVNFKAYADIITMLDALSVDRAVGEALQRIAKDKDVPILSGRAASGKITITDIGINKVSSLVYAGQPAPVAGSQVIYVSDASKFSATGSIYLGRKTPNNEGPLKYISVQAEGGGAYWSITLDPSSLTTKFHNIGEEVVMAQSGDRAIKAGTLVQTPQGSAVTSVSFKTISNATILDGEVSISDIPVVCLDIGSKGNIPKGAIKEAIGLSFTAAVTNPNPFSNGTAPDTDETLRARIKEYEQTKSKGTEKAVQVSALNVIAPDELKKVLSSAIVRYSDNSASLVFDDGSSYEPVFTGVGIEQVVDEALGGEVEVQLRKRPIAQARVKNNIDAPYSIADGDSITIEIQGAVSTHSFAVTDFKVATSATLDELVNSINSNPNFLAYASTADNGTRLVMYPRDRKANDIKVNSNATQDANVALGFPTTKQYTILLYKNDSPLYQDGLVATLSTRIKPLWATNISVSETLTYQVDGATTITVTLTDADFQNVDPTASLSSDATLAVWAEVLNNVMPGVSVTVNGEALDLTSNRGASSRAKIYIIGGTLKDKIFTVGELLLAEGQASDYTLNLQTGQISLATPLVQGESLVAGSSFTRAKFLTNSIPIGPTTGGSIWMVVDGATEYIPNSLKSNTIVTFTNINTDKLQVTGQSATSGSPEGFDNVQVGDWFLIWTDSNDETNYPALSQHKGFWRVEEVSTGSIIVHVGDNSSLTNGFETAIPTDRFSFVRTDAPLQELTYGIGSLSDFANAVVSSVAGVSADIVGAKVRISTNTADLNGELYIVATNTGGKSLGATANTRYTNVTSALGFVATTDSEAGMPEFGQAVATAKNSNSSITVPQWKPFDITYGSFLEMLNKVNSSNVNIIDSNVGRRVTVTGIDALNNILTYKNPKYMTGVHSIQNGDRFFWRSAYQFDSRDTVTLIGDGDTTSKTYTLPVARKLTVSNHSTPTTASFSANDAESSLDLYAPSSFYDFDFSTFKVWRQPFSDLTDGTYNIRIKHNDFGPSGNRVGVGLIYPTAITQNEIALVSDQTSIGIRLPVTSPRIANWNGTTAFTTSKTTTGGKDEVTFTYRVGDEPDFSSIGANVNIGDIVFVNANANFLAVNKDFRARVSDATATSFTITTPVGDMVTDEVEFSSVINQNGLITVTSTSNHGIKTGDRVGFYDTEPVTTGVDPYKDTYIAKVTSDTVFTVVANSNIPSGKITAGTHAGNVVTVTSVGHGLSTGNVILVSGATQTSYNGTHIVSAVVNSDKFQYIVSGSSPSITSGRFDYQSWGTDGSTLLVATSFALSNYSVSVITGTHSLTAGMLVEISNASFQNWYAGGYSTGALVTYDGNTYIKNSTPMPSGETISTPPSESVTWDLSFLTINGRHVIDSVSSNAIVFKVSFSGPSSGVTTGYSCNVSKVVSKGKLARCLGNSGELLAFAEVSTTAQELVDYITDNYADYVTASNLGDGSAVINKSTADNDSLTNYLTGTISQIKKYTGRRHIDLRSDILVPAGSLITFEGQTYKVFDVNASGSYYYLTVRIEDIQYNFSITSVNYPFTAYTPFIQMSDGENYVGSNDLQSLGGTPMFQCVKAWVNAPEIGEEIRLVALNADQLVRFWNKLVVTGLSSIASIKLSEYDRQIQIMTNLFGSGGSIQIAGGSANSNQVAVVGSASPNILDGQRISGSILVPFEARQGFSRYQWVSINQSSKQNKDIGLKSDSVIQAFTDGLSINSGSGTFQTQRTTSLTLDSQFTVEKHGDFQAFIGFGDHDKLGLQNIKEGDWVRIKNDVSFPAWSAVTAYAATDKVTYQSYTWKCAVGNTNQEPVEGSPYWARLGVSSANEGIFLVVRTFYDAFWIENPNAIEEVIRLSSSNDITFYSYDSVMPGDNLVISGDILGQNNIGRYTVVDEAFGSGYYFPTSTRIYTKPIPLSSGGGISVGDSFNQINVEEKSTLRLWKKIIAIVPNFGLYANIVVDSPILIDKVTSSAGAYLTSQGKLNFSLGVNYGVDSYRYYKGLIAELNRVVYGDPTDPINYPGSRAAGTDIDIKPSIIKKITISVSVRLRTGTPFSEIRERVKSSIAGYVNTLGVGEQVSLSKVVEAAQKINGVISVVIDYPTYTTGSDLIYVGPAQKAQIVDPTSDVTVSIQGT